MDRGLVQPPDSSQELAVTVRGEEQLSFIGGLVLPFVMGNWVVCEYLLSLGGGVGTISGTITGAQQLAAKCLHTGVCVCVCVCGCVYTCGWVGGCGWYVVCVCVCVCVCVWCMVSVC